MLGYIRCYLISTQLVLPETATPPQNPTFSAVGRCENIWYPDSRYEIFSHLPTALKDFVVVASMSQTKPVVLRSGSSGYITHCSDCVRLRSNSASSAELISCVGAGSPVLNRVGHLSREPHQIIWKSQNSRCYTRF